VTFDGKPVRMPRRDIAIVFQDYGKALLPWRTAAGNVSPALEASHVASSRRATRLPVRRRHRLLGVIGYLTALTVSVVEKRLLKWRSSGH